MKTPILLSIILLASLIITPSVFAATSATQTVTGTLGVMKQVEANGGPIDSNIDANDGTLLTTLTPGFLITTNTNSSQNLELTALCNTTGGNVNAFSDKGGGGNRYIAITNSGALPTSAAVTNALSAAPTTTSNANVIAYVVTPPLDTPGSLTFTWQTIPQKYTAVLTHKGTTSTFIGLPSTTAATNTYSFDDEPGSYKATITLSFV